MKYLIYLDDGTEYGVTFPREINHNRMAEALGALRFGADRNWHRRQGEVVAAGFIDKLGVCSGYSETLHIGSRKQTDTNLFAQGGCRPVEKEAGE